MELVDKLCRLCANEPESSVLLENLQEVGSLLKLNFPETKSACVCIACFTFLNKIQTFAEQCTKSIELFRFLLQECSEGEVTIDAQQLREQYGLKQYDKIDGSTNTFDINLEIKEETQNIIDTGCDDDELHASNELEDFGETSSITIRDEDVLDTTDVIEPQLTAYYIKNVGKRRKMEGNRRTAGKHSCKLCHKSYSHQQSLHSHMKKVHRNLTNDEDRMMFPCKNCSKQFDTERKLKAHEQVHLPDDKKIVHSCPYCEKLFTKSVNVQAHIRSIHKQERPYLCSDCGKSFSTKGALHEHLIIHVDDFPYQCSYCPKKFKNLPRLKTHEDIHNSTQYICNTCGLSLNTKRTLKMHMVCHSEDKNYKCQYCGSSFKRSKALKNHLILHSGLRPYSCPFCDKTFANGSNCRSHKKKSHPEELKMLEASGKQVANATNIPRLEQLRSQIDNSSSMQSLDGQNLIIQPIINVNVKQELPSLIIQHPENFQLNSNQLHIIQSSPILATCLIESQTNSQ